MFVTIGDVTQLPREGIVSKTFQKPVSVPGFHSRGHLQRCRSSTMSPHRLRRGALHLPTRRQERGPS